MQTLYRFWGKVREGKKRGRKLGFPTANIALHKTIPSGIYISYIRIGTKQYPSLTFIGEAKTFEETLFQAETYILDFHAEIYHQQVTVNLLKKIRENQKFDSGETLIQQMKKDTTDARFFFANEE